MLDINNFTNRLQQILNHYHLTASAFADSIQVQRSGISHVLSGRNKPSLEFVMKITDVYKEVSLLWLLYGQGHFPQKNGINSFNTDDLEVKTEPQHAELPKQPSLFANSPVNEPETTEAIHTKPLTNSNSSNEIEQIVIFYRNGSFKTYSPK